MADKKKGLSFLQLPIPPQVKRAKVTKRSWTELNMRQTVDSGALSSEYNICTDAFPALMTADKPESVFAQFHGQKVLSIHGFDEFLIIVSVDKNDDGKSGIKFTRIKKVADGYTAKFSDLYLTKDVQSIRSIIQFNVFKNDDQTESLGEYDRKLIVFPDKVSFDYDESGDKIIVKSIEVSDENGNLTNAVPDIKYATVHLSRVFGVDDSMVYASAFNDYTNWTVDTADEYNEANAWYTASQSNSKADGVFTGITTFQNHVVCFKKDFMHEIYNTKNPFRLQDIYAEGAIDNRTICDVDGQLIFCSEDGVKVYTGGNPRIISYNLGIDDFSGAVAGTDGGCYYLYRGKDTGNYDDDGNKIIDHLIYVYDTYCQAWSVRTAKNRIIGFAKCNFGFFCIDDTGVLTKLDTASADGVEWSFETDLMTTGSCDIKHVDKLQMCCDIDDGGSVNITIIDEKDTEQELWSSGSRDGYVVARVKIRKSACNAFKIRVSGVGNVCIRSMELFIKQGGELYE